MMFQKATREKLKLRFAIAAPSGAGKTYTALKIGKRFGRIAVIDTENRSASRYADQFEFDVLEMDPPFHPDRLIEAINSAESAGYDLVIVDSLSHFWAGQGGILEIVDQIRLKSGRGGSGGNGFTAWKDGTAIFNEMVDKIIRCKIHIICTMRSKSEYLQTEDERGRKKIEKIGTAPIQRDGLEYEFDIVYDMDLQHRAIVSKSRVFGAPEVVREPGDDLAELLYRWTEAGVEPTPRPSPSPKSAPTSAPGSPEMFSDLPKERQDKARAKFWALANDVFPENTDSEVRGFCKRFLAANADGKPSISVSTVAQVSDAIKALEKHHLAILTVNGAKN